MVPITRLSTVGGVPLTNLIPNDKLQAIVDRTRTGGAELVKLYGNGSAYFAPAAAAIEMAEAYLGDQKRVIPCCTWLEGEFGLEAEAMGQNFDGPAVLEFAVVEGDGQFDANAPRPAAAGNLQVPTSWWGPHEVRLDQPLRLNKGPKRLLVSFVNDKYEENKGDRNAWLAAVSLVAPHAEYQSIKPQVRMTYPHDNDQVSKVFGQGAVVVEPTSATLVRRIELLIDGQPTGMAMDVGRRTGPFVIQYSTAGLEPGKPLFQTVVDALVVAGFEVQAR